ncbi:hypothetical protein FSP39_006497 [Pinctada imbricata]|uniref:RING-type domain-containing protein n=1 Tax=Pinctada imbricata TaxID=66713 RepID=A0AA88Y2H4_PINIB|nr:hypothetical protein FSP39_006497 [Pinctada imbricata]
MVQGVLSLGEDEFRSPGFHLLQTVVALIVVFFVITLNPSLVIHTKKLRKHADDTVEKSCEHEENSHSGQNESKSQKNTSQENVNCKWSRKYLHSKRKVIDRSQEQAENEKLSTDNSVVKLIGKPVKYVASRSWKGFRRKQKIQKMSKSYKVYSRLYKKHKKKKPYLVKGRKRGTFAKVIVDKEILKSSEKILKAKHFISSFSPVNGIPSVILHLYPIYRSLESYFQTILNSPSTNESVSDRMRFEWLRFVSFAGERDIPVRPIFLARSGFYATGYNNDTMCYSCGTEYSEWSEHDNPDDVHRRISPNCPHITTGDVRNRPIHQESDTAVLSPNREGDSVRSRQEGDIVRNSRREDDQTANEADDNNRNVSPVNVAHFDTMNTQSNGFSTISNDGSSLNETHAADTEQRQHESLNQTRNETDSGRANTSNQQASPGRPRSETHVETPQNQRRANSATQIARLDPLGINFDRPRYAAYAILTVRISSYQGWPSHLTQTPRQLSLAGFFYAGYGDYVRCFFCGGGLRNWESEDDPWVEHARWFPRCAFLRQNKGHEFVQLVQDQHQSGNIPIPENTADEASKTSVDESRRTATEALIEMGYQRETIQTAINQFHRRYGKGNRTNCSAEILVDIIGNTQQENAQPTDDHNDTENSHNETNDLSTGDQLVAENRRLRRQRLCRVCQDKDANIAMLPCGHLLCCSDCAPAMRKCPACKAIVKGTVRTFLV